MVDYAKLVQEIERIAGSSALLPPEMCPSYAVEGKVPQVVVFPETVEQIAEILSLANREGATVIPRGGGTKLHWGGIPRQVDIVLGLERMNQILEHEPADLTVTMQAGTRIQALQDRLGEKGQFVPLDPPFPQEATIGGTIATNASGPKRLLYGTVRDFLLGVKVVHADGRISRAGGKVVKNVAGYDLNKLYVGSYGTLGVLVEMTLKLLPRPETERLFFATFPDLASAVRVASQIFQSELRPSAIELLNSRAGALLCQELGISITSGPLILVGIDDVALAAERQYTQMQRYCMAEDSVEIISLSEEKQRRLWNIVRSFSRIVREREAEALICRINVVPSRVGDLFQKAEELEGSTGLPVALLAHFGNGVVFLNWTPETGHLDVEKARDLVQTLIRTAGDWQGNFFVEAAPLAVKEAIDVWGPLPKGVGEVMRGIKAALDPGHILNPGRFVAGI